jgi:hypothetical protein
MFEPTREQARGFFFETWRKYRAKLPLAGAETTILDVILLHPEYHALLDAPDKYVDKDYTEESNPFLHMSLHLAMEEQLSIGQPHGITERMEALTRKTGDRHEALHEAIECLAEMVWRAQKDKTPPDAGFYLDCLRKRAGG